jgi:hypothetical protein
VSSAVDVDAERRRASACCTIAALESAAAGGRESSIAPWSFTMNAHGPAAPHSKPTSEVSVPRRRLRCEAGAPAGVIQSNAPQSARAMRPARHR